jgi:hypothetical protein
MSALLRGVVRAFSRSQPSPAPNVSETTVVEDIAAPTVARQHVGQQVSATQNAERTQGNELLAQWGLKPAGPINYANFVALAAAILSTTPAPTVNDHLFDATARGIEALCGEAAAAEFLSGKGAADDDELMLIGAAVFAKISPASSREEKWRRWFGEALAGAKAASTLRASLSAARRSPTRSVEELSSLGRVSPRAVWTNEAPPTSQQDHQAERPIAERRPAREAARAALFPSGAGLAAPAPAEIVVNQPRRRQTSDDGSDRSTTSSDAARREARGFRHPKVLYDVWAWETAFSQGHSLEHLRRELLSQLGVAAAKIQQPGRWNTELAEELVDVLVLLSAGSAGDARERIFEILVRVSWFLGGASPDDIAKGIARLRGEKLPKEFREAAAAAGVGRKAPPKHNQSPPTGRGRGNGRGRGRNNEGPPRPPQN